MKIQRELWKERRTLITVGTLNIGTMTGRGRELADITERRNVDILCLGGEQGVNQTNGHETGSKRVNTEHNKRVCSTG